MASPTPSMVLDLVRTWAKALQYFLHRGPRTLGAFALHLSGESVHAEPLSDRTGIDLLSDVSLLPPMSLVCCHLSL